MRDGSNSVTRSRLIATSWKANTVTGRGAYLMGLPPLRALSLLLKRTPPAALSPSVTLMRAPGLKAGRYSGTIECWIQTFQDASAKSCYLIAWTLDHYCSKVLRLIHYSQQRCKVFRHHRTGFEFFGAASFSLSALSPLLPPSSLSFFIFCESFIYQSHLY